MALVASSASTKGAELDEHPQLRRFAAFIAHSHPVDGGFAARLSRRLQRFSHPWYRRSSIRIQVDGAETEGRPGLSASSEAILDDSEFLLLLASPDSAREPRVRHQVAHWLHTRGTEGLLIAVTDGTLAWDATAGQVDRERTDCLPPELLDRMAEPRWVDLRPYRHDRRLRSRDLQDHLADLAAPLRGQTKEELLAVENTRVRRTASGLAALAALAVTAAAVAGIGSRVAEQQRKTAIDQQRVAQEQQRLALNRQLVAQANGVYREDPRVAARLALAALHIGPASGARAVLAQAVTASPITSTLLGHTNGIMDEALSPDGRTLVTAGFDGMLIFWEVSDRHRPVEIHRMTLSSPVTSVQFSPDGHRLAAGLGDNTILLWDVTVPAAPVQVSKLSGHRAAIAAVAFGSDGVLISGGYDAAVVIWDLYEGKGTCLCDTHKHGLADVIYYGDKSLLLTIDVSRVVLWRMKRTTAEKIAELPRADPGYAAMAISPDGSLLATTDLDFKTTLWNISDAQHPVQLGQPLAKHTHVVRAVAFSPDGHTLATAGDDLSVFLWDLADPANPTPLSCSCGSGHTGPIRAVTFFPDGKALAVASLDRTATLWDLTASVIPSAIAEPLVGHTKAIVSMAQSATRRLLATGSSDTTVALWDLADVSRVRVLGQPLAVDHGAVNDLAFSPDGRRLATAGQDGTVLVWDVADPSSPKRTGAALTNSGAFSLVFSPDGRLLATSDDSTATIWDLADPAHPVRHTLDSRALRTVISSDGRRLITAGADRALTFWDITDLDRPVKLGRVLTEHADLISAMQLTPDGRTLMTASLDWTVQFWDVRDAAHPTRVGQRLIGADETIWSAALSADGTLLATANRSGKVSMWDVTDPAEPARLGPTDLTADTGSINRLAFVGGDQVLVTAGQNHAIRFWDLTALHDARANLVARACSFAGRALTAEEWSTYLPGVAFVDMCAAGAK